MRAPTLKKGYRAIRDKSSSFESSCGLFAAIAGAIENETF